MKNPSIYTNAPKYAHYYIDQVESNDLITEFEKSKELTLATFKLITSQNENYSYAPGKWTVKQVMRHVVDMERIFAIGAFRFSHFDNTELPGVEEDDYVDERIPEISLSDLKDEYLAVRTATVWIYRNSTDEMLDFKGIANKQPYTARSLGFATIGHNIHHCNVIRERYLGI